MQLEIWPVSSAQFTHNADTKMLVVEASEVGPIHQLYDDACDIGIAIRSDRTGAITYWYLCESETQHDADGDIVAQYLYPTVETVRKFPHLEGYKITMFND